MTDYLVKPLEPATLAAFAELAGRHSGCVRPKGRYHCVMRTEVR
jgi:hypothetical protein